MNKNQIIDELINNKEKSEKEVKDKIINPLREEYKKNNDYLCDLQYELIITKNETGFKYYNHSRRKGYCYFVSNIGRVMLVGMPENELDVEKEYDNNIFKYDCRIIPQHKTTLCLDIDWFKSKEKNVDFVGYILNSSTPVYTMVGEAWLADEYKEMSKAYPDERIELHHIDGNNLNCKTDNLIYLPNHIHAVVHTKN